jgi:hypothetical protein
MIIICLEHFTNIAAVTGGNIHTVIYSQAYYKILIDHIGLEILFQCGTGAAVKNVLQFF